MTNSNLTFFDSNGWRLPKDSYQTFSNNPKWFFKLGDYSKNYEDQLSQIDKYTDLPRKNEALIALEKILDDLKSKKILENLINGPKVPFAIKKTNINDIGEFIENTLLKNVSKSFQNSFPDSHFKAVIQDKTSLKGRLSITENSGYNNFLETLKNNDICGFYFPQVLQEYSVDSQILQMQDLLKEDNLCLSGPVEVATSLVGSPNLLINFDSYSPVLCLSAVKHIDPRLICCFKSYGLHLEFWCLSQMLTKTTKQVSEQWSGGLTLFAKY